MDSSGNGHNGTPTGGLSFAHDTSPEAPGSYSLVVPSGGSYSSFFTTSGYTGPQNNFTMELFFKTTQSSGIGFLATTFDHTSTDGDGTGGWDIGIDNGKMYFETLEANSSGPDSARLFSSSSSYADGEWHELAVTLSSTNVMQLYVDYQLQGQIQGQLPSSARNDLLFGDSYVPSFSGDNFHYTGSLDDIRLSSVVLQSSQLLMSSSASAPEPCSLVVVLACVSTLMVTGSYFRNRS